MQYIDSALESALIALFEMASSNKDLWISDLRNLICTSFGRGWRVNGEQSGRTKLIYVFNEGKGENNPRTTATLNIEWKQQSVPKIIAAIEYIKPLVVEKNISLGEAAKRWKAQNLPEEKKVTDVIWAEVLKEFKRIKAEVNTAVKGYQEFFKLPETTQINLIEEVLVKFENQPRNVKALLKQQGIYSRLIECSQKDSSKRVSQPQN